MSLFVIQSQIKGKEEGFTRENRGGSVQHAGRRRRRLFVIVTMRIRKTRIRRNTDQATGAMSA